MDNKTVRKLRALRELSKYNHIFQLILLHRRNKKTDLFQFHRHILNGNLIKQAIAPLKAPELSDMRELFKELEKLGIGSFTKDMRRPDRVFIWKYDSHEVVNVALGKGVELTPIQPVLKREPELIKTQLGYIYQFLLRPDFVCKVTLPLDFKSVDINQLIHFVKKMKTP